MKHIQRHHTGRFIQPSLWLGCLLIGFMVWAGPSFAGSDTPPGFGQHRGNAKFAGEGALTRSVIKVTIEKKSNQKVTTYGGIAYAMSKATQIVGEDGKQVRLLAMRVPCDAKITYAVINGVRRALRIEILSTGGDATANMDYEKPQ